MAYQDDEKQVGNRKLSGPIYSTPPSAAIATPQTFTNFQTWDPKNTATYTEDIDFIIDVNEDHTLYSMDTLIKKIASLPNNSRLYLDDKRYSEILFLAEFNRGILFLSKFIPYYFLRLVIIYYENLYNISFYKEVSSDTIKTIHDLGHPELLTELLAPIVGIAKPPHNFYFLCAQPYEALATLFWTRMPKQSSKLFVFKPDTRSYVSVAEFIEGTVYLKRAFIFIEHPDNKLDYYPWDLPLLLKSIISKKPEENKIICEKNVPDKFKQIIASRIDSRGTPSSSSNSSASSTPFSSPQRGMSHFPSGHVPPPLELGQATYRTSSASASPVAFAPSAIDFRSFSHHHSAATSISGTPPARRSAGHQTTSSRSLTRTPPATNRKAHKHASSGFTCGLGCGCRAVDG